MAIKRYPKNNPFYPKTHPGINPIHEITRQAEKLPFTVCHRRYGMDEPESTGPTFYCVAWVNTPPLGAQYLSLIPRPLAAGRVSFSLSSYYEKTDRATQMFFAEKLNKLLFAVTAQTAAEIILDRAYGQESTSTSSAPMVTVAWAFAMRLMTFPRRITNSLAGRRRIASCLEDAWRITMSALHLGSRP